jgi:putative phage-type endonuclease
MANQYHDEQGRFCSRNEMRRALTTAGLAGNTEVWIRLKTDLVAADIEANYMPSRKHSTIYPALANATSDLMERDRLITEGIREEGEAWLKERIENETFHELLDDRDLMKVRADEAKEEYKLAKEMYDENPTGNYDLVREKGLQARELYEEYMLLRAQVNQYKDIHAPLVADLTEKMVEEQKADGEFREYNKTTLNQLEETGEFPSGSREWLEQRTKGIGGSDVGKIIGVSPEYVATDFKEVFGSKIDPITDEQVEEQAGGHIEYQGYTGRGNAWEDRIANMYAEKHPEQNITYCKTSWQNKDRPYQFANFDGLMVDENGNPNGILEIKTGSKAEDWGNPADGLAAVPPQYRAQVLWYCDAAGFNKGAVAVVLDDHEYREYAFTVTPELKEEMLSNRTKVEAFVARVDRVKAGIEVDPREPKNIAGREMFSKTMLSQARNGHLEAFQEASILREETPQEALTRYNSIVSSNGGDGPAALKQLYTEKPLSERKQKWVHLDIETSNMTPYTGHVIEVGVSVRGPQGGEVEKFQKLYGIPKRAVEGVGTGAVDVHGITPGMIAKKRTFMHPEEQRKMLTLLKSGITVAHNAGFEKQWLRMNLKGFKEAEETGEIRILDTKTLTSRLLTKTPNATLKSFCENYEIPYENAHRAYNDAVMMGEGLDGMLKDFDSKRNK